MKRVLVVEDEVLIGMQLSMLLEDAGHEVVGPVDSVEAALNVLTAPDAGIDCVLLDINLNGEKSYPVAHALIAEQIPFVLLTGHDVGSLPPALQQSPFFRKPYDANHLVDRVTQLLHD